MDLECGDHKLRFLEVTGVEIIDNNIRVEHYLLKKLDLASLQITHMSTSITLRTPSGTLISVSAWHTVPRMRFGFYGCRC